MLDTVQIKHVYTYVSEDHLIRIGAVPLRSRRNETFVINPEPGSPFPRLSFIRTPDNVLHLHAEFEVPKILYGHNAVLPSESEVRQAVECVSEYVERRSELSFKPETATVRMAHFAKDLSVGMENVIPTINILSRRTLPRFIRKTISDSTLYFDATARSNKSQIRIYSKLDEVLSHSKWMPEAEKAARGNIRIEYNVSGRAFETGTKALGLSDRRTVNVLNETVSRYFVNKAIDGLAIRDAVSVSGSDLIRLLRVHGPRKAYRLFGFLEAVRTFGGDFYKDPIHRISKATYFRDARDCRKAEVWPS